MTSARTFEALCILASQEKWCWHIPCTTCGNADFRFALREFATGELSKQWWSISTHRTELRGRLAVLEPLGHWPIGIQRGLISKIEAADLDEIAHEGRFPDWLGFLGLALLQTEEAELEDRRLTGTWARRLLKLLPARARQGSRMTALVEGSEAILTWRDLESVEQAILSGSARSAHGYGA